MDHARTQQTDTQPQTTLAELTRLVHSQQQEMVAQQQELLALKHAIARPRRRQGAWTDYAMRLGLALMIVIVTVGFGARASVHAAPAPVTSTFNALQVALLRWYETNQGGARILLNGKPSAMAFDGAHLWVANNQNNTLTKVRVSDGAVIGTYPVGSGPVAVAFDGLHIWVANNLGRSLQKIKASDGSVVAGFTLATKIAGGPTSLVFDGTALWVGHANQLSKIRVTDGHTLATYPLPGVQPTNLAFDGTNIWVTLQQINEVQLVRASDATLVHTVNNNSKTDPTLLAQPSGIAFDGQSMWITNRGNGTTVRITPIESTTSDGSPAELLINTATYSVGTTPSGIAFDGANMWVTNSGSQSMTKIEVGDGRIVGTYPAGGTPTAIAFDGANMWVVNTMISPVKGASGIGITKY